MTRQQLERQLAEHHAGAVRHVFDFSAVLINTGVLKVKPAS